MKERLQKILSARGVASRRAAEEMIAAGRVRVNGTTAAVGMSADASADLIEIDGRPLAGEAGKVYIMLNKPRGWITTMQDDKGRRSVTELVRDCPVRVWPVGRLDMDSEGLLIMTNDGDLTHLLTHPSHEKDKCYSVRVRGDASAALGQLSEPMTVDGVDLRPAVVRLAGKTEDGAVLAMTIREGKNRQIRKMCAQAGLEVIALRRTAEGGLKLGGLQSGRWRYLSAQEVALLRGGPEKEPRRRAEK